MVIEVVTPTGQSIYVARSMRHGMTFVGARDESNYAVT